MLVNEYWLVSAGWPVFKSEYRELLKPTVMI